MDLIEAPDRATSRHAGKVGFCHACGTMQTFGVARWVWMGWAERHEWACVNCDNEPWGLGVWPAVLRRGAPPTVRAMYLGLRDGFTLSRHEEALITKWVES